ncbi:MAG TPA: hypothetical protein VK177_18165 [Flavobacteriales bacterium]|nr:hypothetical protein [Flavobacteriales bacterium]
MNSISIFILIAFFVPAANPKLDRDFIFPKAAQEKAPPGESFEVITEKDMFKAKEILKKSWNKNESDTTWAKYNRQYMLYNSNQMGKVVFIAGTCNEETDEYFATTWTMGMRADKCYYYAFVDLKKKKVVNFLWNVYGKK